VEQGGANNVTGVQAKTITERTKVGT
jgi:hypothetical protein